LRLAWRTGEESVSALNYAWQLLMLPHGVLALSVSTVILPTLSRLWQAGDTAAFRATLGNALRPLLFLSLPAAVTLFTFRLPIVQTLFQTGAFSAQSTALVAAPLAFLAAGLVSYALVEALTRAFYAMHDTRTPVIAGIVIMVLNVLVGVALLNRLGYLALALALSLSTTVEAIILSVILGRRLGGVSTRIRDWLLRVIAASAVTAVVAALLADPLSEATTPGNGPKLQQIVVFLFALGVVAVVYLGCAWMLRIPELSGFMALLARRVPPLRRLASLARR
jgi:putative peptidoglycan lipid II flippase